MAKRMKLSEALLEIDRLKLELEAAQKLTRNVEILGEERLANALKSRTTSDQTFKLEIERLRGDADSRALDIEALTEARDWWEATAKTYYRQLKALQRKHPAVGLSAALMLAAGIGLMGFLQLGYGVAVGSGTPL